MNVVILHSAAKGVAIIEDNPKIGERWEYVGTGMTIPIKQAAHHVLSH